MAKAKAKVDVYQMVTDRVVELLEQGVVPWRKPWKGASCHPCNGKTGHVYRGINPFLLQAVQIAEGFTDHRWLTFKQVGDAGGKVVKGSKSTLVTFWRWIEVVEKEGSGKGEKKRVPLLKYFRVFNLEQTEGVDLAKLKAQSDEYEPTEWEAIEAAEVIADKWLDESGLSERIVHKGGRACYVPALDSLRMPERDRFEKSAEYYSTLFHELTHSTGHKDRLARLDEDGFGSDPYAREELVAEMGAAFLCGECGLLGEVEQNSAAYLQAWIKVLKGDKKLIAGAAAAAQKASDLILGRKWEGETKAGESEAVQPKRV